MLRPFFQKPVWCRVLTVTVVLAPLYLMGCSDDEDTAAVSSTPSLEVDIVGDTAAIPSNVVAERAQVQSSRLAQPSVDAIAAVPAPVGLSSEAGSGSARQVVGSSSLPALPALPSTPSIPVESREDLGSFRDESARADFDSGENYNVIVENSFVSVQEQPLSTFSIDVDSASYSNVRRFLINGTLPPPDAVRIEEMINYFTYDYPQPDPECECPFVLVGEMSEAPWNPDHRLVHIGLQGQKIDREDLPPNNLVFLIDVSGSMTDYNKLPLLKSAIRLMVNELDDEDRVSLVVYAGSAGVVLPPTSGQSKGVILAAIDRLEAGGSTAGGQGIQLAYALAAETFLPEGNNRVILATDGDFNVGMSSESDLVDLIESKREQDIFLTVLGFGTGNLQEAQMEQITNHGNGNYAYIDSEAEAKKVLVNELGATLFTIAKDVKLQVEFNPTKVQSYRLIGYENRILAAQDFNDDTKDAGELGAGHSVTALYEVIPVGIESDGSVDPLRYQDPSTASEAAFSDELMLLKLRYKEPTGDASKLMETPVVDRGISLEQTSPDFRLSAAVASFGMMLRNSEYQGASSPQLIQNLMAGPRRQDPEGYQAEFLNLVERYQHLSER